MNHTSELSPLTPESTSEDVTGLIRPAPALDAIHQAALQAAQMGFEPATTIGPDGERIVLDRARF